MSKKCPQCESKDIHITEYPYPTDNMATCYGCGYADLAERFPEQTLFDTITASEEVLAPALVFHIEKTVQSRELQYNIVSWGSTIIPERTFETESEAIAATVAKLKEIEK